MAAEPTATVPASAEQQPTATPENEPPSFEIDPNSDNAEAELRAAIAASRATTVITIGAGILQLEEELVVKRNLHLVGAGPQLTTIASTSRSAINFTGLKLTLEGLTIEWTGAEQGGARVPVVSIQDGRIFMDDVAISNSSGHGLRATGSGGLITNSHFHDNGGSGVYLMGDSDVEIRDSSASNNEEGFSFSGSTFHRLEQTVAYNNRVAGYAWYDTAIAIATAPVAENNGSYGYLATEKSDPWIIKGVSTGHSIAGALFTDDARGRFDEPDFRNNATDFINRSTANPTIEGACPPDFTPVDDKTCERRYQPTEYTCNGPGLRLKGSQCIREYEGVWDDTCPAPYLAYRATVPEHPTAPGGDVTCLWFDSAGSCPADDAYVEHSETGTFSHRCARAPERVLRCGGGEVVTTVCQSSGSAGFVCYGATPDPITRECVERRNR